MSYTISNCLKPNLAKISLNNFKCGDAMNQIIESDDCCIDDDSTIEIFLRGYCTAFSIALNQIFNYKIYKLKDERHYFCMINKNGRTFYIDVRGITDSIDGLLDYFNSNINEIELDNNSCYNDEFIPIAVNYAKAFIEKNKDYYSIE